MNKNPDTSRSSKLAELEALLFIHGEPLAESKIAKILHLTKEDCATLLREFDVLLREAQRGLGLAVLGEKVQLVTKSEFSPIVQEFVKEELSEELTPASIEALSLVLYLGPISRSRLEYIRGVNSTFILRSLSLRGLVERYPDPKNPHVFLYAPTHALIRHLGVTKQEDLHDFQHTQSLLRAFETQESPQETS